MHRLYREVLRTHYAHMSERSRERVEQFYRALPEPALLSREFIIDRLDGLAVGSRSIYISFFRPVCAKLNIDISDLKSRAARSHVKRSDLYTSEEIDLMLANAGSTRNRAIIALLVETGFRAFELLQLSFESIRTGQDMWWLSVQGKRNIVREVPVRFAIAPLQQWLDVHPVGKGPLWVSERFPHTAIKYRWLHKMIIRVQSENGIRVRRYPVHLFRHTRLTELATRLREAELRLFAGWESGSVMPRTYVHLAAEDLDASFRRIYELEQKPESTRMNMESVVCPRCKTANSPGARFCVQCSLALGDMQSVMDQTPMEQMRELREQMQTLREDLEVQKQVRRIRKRLG